MFHLIEHDFHDKNKQKMKKFKKRKTGPLSHFFSIGSLPFYHGTDPQDKLVPNVVENEHLVFPLIGIFVQIRLKVHQLLPCLDENFHFFQVFREWACTVRSHHGS